MVWGGMKGYVEGRKKIESYLIKKLVRMDKDDTSITIYKLDRGLNRRILTFSPYSFDGNTSSRGIYYRDNWYMMKSDTAMVYSSISRKMHDIFLHDNYGRREEIKDKIQEYVPYNSREDLTFQVVKTISESYEAYVKFCNRRGMTIVNKHTWRRVRNLCMLWRVESEKYHYQMTKQEKRKLKKLYKIHKKRKDNKS